MSKNLCTCSCILPLYRVQPGSSIPCKLPPVILLLFTLSAQVVLQCFLRFFLNGTPQFCKLGIKGDLKLSENINMGLPYIAMH